jgi:uncharacterized protein YfaS (alpha-2-macroglobulin family)
MNKHIRILLSGMLLLGSHAFAQKSAPLKMYDFEPSWKKVDSLNNALLPESAEKVARDILKKAQSIQDEPQIIKAQTWLMMLNQEEHADVLAIKASEKQLAAATNPVQKALWANVTAKAYQSYLSANRYTIYGRTQSSQQQSTDVATWDVNALHDTITQLYKTSLQDRDALRNILTSDYSAIISKGEHTAHLRPYLYDVLVFDAIDYFSSDERTITKPAYAFQLNEAGYFADAATFASMKLEHKDNTALHFQALKLYQEVIQRQIALKNNDALIDADLLRLGFVHTYSTLPDKDALYSKALEQVINRASKQDDVAQAMFLLQQQKYNQYQEQLNRTQNAGSKLADQTDLKSIAASLAAIITAYPKSEGAANARNLLDALNSKQLSVNMQSVQIPEQPVLASVGYKNVGNTEMMLYKLSPENFTDQDPNLKGKPLRTWQQALPNSDDLKAHRAEIKIDALPMGQYVLIVRNLGSSMDTLYHYFQVSNLSIVKGPNDYRSGTTSKVYILDREKGTPVENATLQYKKDKWISLAKSGKDGLLNNTVSNRTVDYNTLFELVQGQDRLILQNEAGSLIEYDRNYTENKKDRYQDFMFTDRSIYRPGQTVYFKGISLKSSYDNRVNNVVANKSVTVTFRDVNRQMIKDITLTTNEYGSFSGSFIAPESGLTGTMFIQTDEGAVYFNVEEYKRPKFQVSFDTVKNNYALNDHVTIKGKAIAYAGNSISNAQVQYRVVRRTRFPYFWRASRWGFPMSSGQQEMTNGTTETDAAGNFNISFKAMPDASIPADAAPVFQYEITADITDINGETRSSSSYFSAGYTGIILEANIPAQSTPEQLSKLSIRTENLNGVFTPAPVSIKVSQLKSPDHFYRERLWEAPTDFILKENEFRTAFPNDMYGEEWKPENRTVTNVVWEHQYTTEEGNALQTKNDIWKQTGYYLIEVNTKDHNGKAVTEKKYVFVWNEKQPEQKEFALFIKNDADKYEPGQQWKQWVVPAYNKAHLLQYNSWNKQLTLAADKSVRQQITEADRGGAYTSWAYVYQNRFYSGSEQINVPWSNKELQLSWATHRDKLQPGAAEEWTLTISGTQKDKVAAEMMATLYDASLDALKPHNWSWDLLQPHKYFYGNWGGISFGQNQASVYSTDNTINQYTKVYPSLFGYLQFNRTYDEVTVYGTRLEARTYVGAVNTVTAKEIAKRPVSRNANAESEDAAAAAPAAADEKAGGQTEPKPEPAVSPRTNLKETAFFMPQMHTDEQGNVVLKFTMPEALTEWKFMAFAHTKDWKTGYLDGKIKTQKELMVTPNVPRFFRQGDEMVLSAKISNLSGKELKGTATISFVNALTGQPLDKAFGQANSSKPFTVAAGDNVPVSFTLNVPQSVYEPVAVSIVAQAGSFSDGESHTIPVVTNRMLVTETLPMPVKGDGTTTFTLDKLLQSNQSNSLVHKGLTIEYTANPAWYAVQALPYLMEYPYECAEQTFNRFYANALAAHIVAQTPKIKAIFDKWSTEDTTALLSNLSKNQELKSALLEETPWVLEAQSEQEQKRNIAKLFATHKMAAELNKSLTKLGKMQNNDGSFSWFEGMRADRYMTQYILTGIAKLQQLNVSSAQTDRIDQIVNKGLKYLDREIVKEYKEIKKEKLKEEHIDQTQLQYLFLRSAFPMIKKDAATQTAFSYYLDQGKKYWTKQNNYMQGMIALSLFRTKEVIAAKSILTSLSERAIRNKETGMYWKNNAGYWWYEAPVETQALMIQAYKEIMNDQASVDQMNIWLLKQKQTQNWRTTTATADACYALLSGNAAWLQNEPKVTIKAGSKTIESAQVQQEAGTGYFKQSIPGAEVSADMGKLSVTVQNSPGAQNAIGWGAAYWQYFENMSKISSSVNENMPLQIEKQLFVSRNSDRGPVLTPITANSPIKVGDKVTVRVIIRADRSMDYVHLKDMRAAGFEPVNVLSGYRYNNGLGYYESTRDLASHFFIDRLNKGTYVFEYQVIANQKGTFSNGITTAQCMYAPEFSSHSEGIQVTIQ